MSSRGPRAVTVGDVADKVITKELREAWAEALRIAQEDDKKIQLFMQVHFAIDALEHSLYTEVTLRDKRTEPAQSVAGWPRHAALCEELDAAQRAPGLARDLERILPGWQSIESSNMRTPARVYARRAGMLNSADLLVHAACSYGALGALAESLKAQGVSPKGVELLTEPTIPLVRAVKLESPEERMAARQAALAWLNAASWMGDDAAIPHSVKQAARRRVYIFILVMCALAAGAFMPPEKKDLLLPMCITIGSLVITVLCFF
jgi:hypothetical protein